MRAFTLALLLSSVTLGGCWTIFDAAATSIPPSEGSQVEDQLGSIAGLGGVFEYWARRGDPYSAGNAAASAILLSKELAVTHSDYLRRKLGLAHSPSPARGSSVCFGLAECRGYVDNSGRWRKMGEQ